MKKDIKGKMLKILDKLPSSKLLFAITVAIILGVLIYLFILLYINL